MKILITGGSGFIGKNLVEHLSRRHEVMAPTHKELDLIDEMAVRSFFDNHPVDIIIHSAVRPGHRNANDPSNQLFNNTRMFFNLVRNSDHFKRMIFLGSGSVYDMRAYKPKMNEDYFDVNVPLDEHGFSKYIVAKYIEQADNIVELRLFGIFGKYEDYAIRFISNAICKTLFDLPITIKQNRRFDYLYIDDLIPVLDYFIENKPKYKCYNVTPDKAIELYQIAGKVIQASGKELPIIVAQNSMGLEYSGSNQRLRSDIPLLSFTSIDQAIGSLYNWYKDNRSIINKELLLTDK